MFGRLLQARAPVQRPVSRRDAGQRRTRAAGIAFVSRLDSVWYDAVQSDVFGLELPTEPCAIQSGAHDRRFIGVDVDRDFVSASGSDARLSGLAKLSWRKATHSPTSSRTAAWTIGTREDPPTRMTERTSDCTVIDPSLRQSHHITPKLGETAPRSRRLFRARR